MLYGHFKLKVVEHALEHGNRAAVWHLNVDAVHVHYWRKQEDGLCATKKDRCAFQGPKHGKLPLVENKVLEYVKRLRSEGCAVSHELIQNHAQATAKNHGIPACDFKASSGWTTRFMRQNGLCLRRSTTLRQQLPANSEIKIQNFHWFVIQMRQEKQFLVSQIGNTNQTALNFDMPQSSMVELKGVKSVHMKATGAESNGAR